MKTHNATKQKSTSNSLDAKIRRRAIKVFPNTQFSAMNAHIQKSAYNVVRNIQSKVFFIFHFPDPYGTRAQQTMRTVYNVRYRWLANHTFFRQHTRTHPAQTVFRESMRTSVPASM
jgi:hypothetical protein